MCFSVEHWDVINENLDEHWYKNRLMDPDFDLETYRLAHSIDPNVKLFINDYAVVATGSDTEVSERMNTRYLSMHGGIHVPEVINTVMCFIFVIM